MDRSGSTKKAVRFSSPFEVEPDVFKTKSSGSIENRRCSKAGLESSDSFSGDSWDAFDAKMLKTKGVAPKEVEHQFLELSSSQNKSLNAGIGETDFSTMSFQDAKGLIERDENERLQFMNSNVSFSEGIDQVEPPSLLSFTAYFQQGSSFPVPYVGNDSTMMFGENLAGVSISDQQTTQAQHHRRQSSQQHQIRRSSTRRSSTSSVNISVGNNEKTDLSRNDSLARFFLGPQSNGMNKVDIMEYVLDYCKRRASCSLSDASDNSPSQTASSGISGKTSEKHDSGIGDGIEEKTVVEKSEKAAQPNNEVFQQKKEHHRKSERSTNNISSSSITALKVDKSTDDLSIMLSDGASMKSSERFLDVSDVGSIDGFEKFKKNLHPHRKLEDKYRAKIKNHLEFEKKRLNVDQRYSHPRLSPEAFRGPGSTASLERPSKNMCNSPPEKLARSRSENAIDNTPSPNTFQATKNSAGQCHSTPVANDTCISKLVASNTAEREGQSTVTNLDGRTDKRNLDNLKRQKLVNRKEIDTSSNHSFSKGVSSTANNSSDPATFKSRTSSKLEEEFEPTKVLDVQGQGQAINRPASIFNEQYNKVLQTVTANSLPQGLSVVPVIHSGLQQQQFGGSQCNCPHQCGQQPASGTPIVIHIHLPCPVTTSGTVVHPVPTPTSEHPK